MRRVGHLGRDGQRGEGARLALELLPECVDVVEVDVRIADAVHKVAWVGLGLGLGVGLGASRAGSAIEPSSL